MFGLKSQKSFSHDEYPVKDTPLNTLSWILYPSEITKTAIIFDHAIICLVLLFFKLTAQCSRKPSNDKAPNI